jgi:hypothetical protein
MATVPVPAQVAPGAFITAALWNANVYAALLFMLAPVRFKAYSSTAQTIVSGTTATPLTLDTELYDSDAGHSTVTNTSRFTVQTAGLYHVTGAMTWASNSTATRTITVLLNGSVVAGSMVQSMPSATNGTTVMTTTDVQAAVGDYIEIGGWHNVGTAGTTTLATTAGGNLGILTTMSLYRVSN